MILSRARSWFLKTILHYKEPGFTQHTPKSHKLPLIPITINEESIVIIDKKTITTVLKSNFQKEPVWILVNSVWIRMVAAARSALGNCSKAVQIVDLKLLKPTKACFITNFLYTSSILILEAPLQIFKYKGILLMGWSVNLISSLRTQDMRAY